MHQSREKCSGSRSASWAPHVLLYPKFSSRLMHVRKFLQYIGTGVVSRGYQPTHPARWSQPWARGLTWLGSMPRDTLAACEKMWPKMRSACARSFSFFLSTVRSCKTCTKEVQLSVEHWQCVACHTVRFARITNKFGHRHSGKVLRPNVLRDQAQRIAWSIEGGACQAFCCDTSAFPKNF